MTNAKKIQILKDNILCFINNSKNIDELRVFNFAKQQAKEMEIEISKGEIKSIVYDIINSSNNYQINDFEYY